jgi:predicted XRE-type DNA-binding protein
VIEITLAVRRLGLMQEEAGRRMGIAQPKVSAMIRGDFVNPSKHKLMDPHAGTRLASARPVMSPAMSSVEWGVEALRRTSGYRH